MKQDIASAIPVSKKRKNRSNKFGYTISQGRSMCQISIPFDQVVWWISCGIVHFSLRYLQCHRCDDKNGRMQKLNFRRSILIICHFHQWHEYSPSGTDILSMRSSHTLPGGECIHFMSHCHVYLLHKAITQADVLFFYNVYRNIILSLLQFHMHVTQSVYVI